MVPGMARTNRLRVAGGVFHCERSRATRQPDLLQVAGALTLESELFLTTDTLQAQLAKSEGLKVASVG
jgi:hypothetical protein